MLNSLFSGSRSKEDEGDEDELLGVEEAEEAGDEDVGPVLQVEP